MDETVVIRVRRVGAIGSIGIAQRGGGT